MATEYNGRDDFIRGQGLPFLAHLLRRISDLMVSEAGDWEDEELGVRAPPRTASTMLLLAEQGPQSVTQIAEKLRQSHPLVISWLRQLEKLAFVKSSTDPADARRTLVALTPTGRAEARRMAEGSEKIGRAYAKLLREADADVHEALWRVHDLLRQGRLAALLRVQKR
jgi:DNA-binding MarR family transcriptional regulator